MVIGLALLFFNLKAQINPLMSIDKVLETSILSIDTIGTVSLERSDSIVMKEDDSSDKQTMFLLRESDILARLNALPIYTWSDDMRHIQPLAQDFSKLFDNNNDDANWSMENAIGVSLAGIKAVAKDLKHNDLIIMDLQKDNEDLKRKIRFLERNYEKQRKEIEILRRQMTDLLSRQGR